MLVLASAMLKWLTWPLLMPRVGDWCYDVVICYLTISCFPDAPKVATVNDQVRAGAGERNAQVADITTTNAQSMYFALYLDLMRLTRPLPP